MTDIDFGAAQAACGYWYACGYNDNRQPGEPYVNPHEFAATWLLTMENATRLDTSRPSLQDAFKLFKARL